MRALSIAPREVFDQLRVYGARQNVALNQYDLREVTLLRNDHQGHMQIAYLAYKRLNPTVRDRADALLKLNPDYANWRAGAPAGHEKLYAFVHAATWADDIKTKPDYYDDQVTIAPLCQRMIRSMPSPSSS